MEISTCGYPKTACDACDNRADLNWRRAMAKLENHYREHDLGLGDYSTKLALLKNIVAEAVGAAVRD